MSHPFQPQEPTMPKESKFSGTPLVPTRREYDRRDPDYLLADGPYGDNPPVKSALDVQVGGGHYKDMAIQPVEFCMKNNLNYCQANVVKYVTRYKAKNGLQDLQKAKHYIDLLIELEYGK